MTCVDFIIISIIIFSALIGLMRGFLSELASFLALVSFITVLSQIFSGISFFQSILLIILVVATIALTRFFFQRLGNNLGKNVFFSSLDILFGLLFGILRGMIITSTVLFFLDLLTQISRNEIWVRSVLIPHFNYIIRVFFISWKKLWVVFSLF